MRGTQLAMWIWPGLLRLWYRGEVAAMALALSFAVLLNLSMVSSFIWPGVLGESTSGLLWLTTLTLWGVSLWRSYRFLPELCLAQTGPVVEDLFLQAQAEYLRGNWFEAQGILEKLMRAEPRDVDARLMLCTIFRRMKRWERAREQLAQLATVPGSEKWLEEIYRERELIDRDSPQKRQPAGMEEAWAVGEASRPVAPGVDLLPSVPSDSTPPSDSTVTSPPDDSNAQSARTC